MLKQMYPDSRISPEEFEVYFKRSWQAVRLKAWKLGLNRTRLINEQINHAYFREITTPEKAYWLGWLASDGYVAIWNRGHYVSLQLQKRDESVIRRFVQDVAPGAQVYRDRNAVCVRIGSKEMFQSLSLYGVDANKTKNFKWPSHLPEEFAMEFLLGYFDGDGCFARYSYGSKTRYHWVLLGTNSFLVSAKQYLNKYADVELSEPTLAHKNKSFHLYKIRSCDRRTIQRIDEVLNRSHLGLTRKHL